MTFFTGHSPHRELPIARADSPATPLAELAREVFHGAIPERMNRGVFRQIVRRQLIRQQFLEQNGDDPDPFFSAIVSDTAQLIEAAIYGDVLERRHLGHAVPTPFGAWIEVLDVRTHLVKDGEGEYEDGQADRMSPLDWTQARNRLEQLGTTAAAASMIVAYRRALLRVAAITMIQLESLDRQAAAGDGGSGAP